ncbi:hypothetical protein GGI43DRAFT_409611 [Trichoderma evansii]
MHGRLKLGPVAFIVSFILLLSQHCLASPLTRSPYRGTAAACMPNGERQMLLAADALLLNCPTAVGRLILG